MSVRAIHTVLFDLDGTLIDSAPDLAGAVNSLRERKGLAPVPYARLRPMVGTGARGMIGAAFGLQPGDEGFDALRDEFLALYERNLLQHTRVFEQMVPVLDALDVAGLRWGIVTNKAERFTLPVVQGLGLDVRAGAVVCGDTTPHAKPHPAPLLEAARRIGADPSACVYVGDDLRDVQAGRAAGMATLAAAWGYLGQGDAIGSWGADGLIDMPGELLKWLDLA
ncbi:HAD-IA family hydrolase [Aquincola sp. J276]|uniref:HAD-IA family hydrolase n=1 Tax=Aquincola sp. J276 TaxID=2898432 RepID=UPI0021516B3F|nr:HAD-IA family hydrolase [Aquincola sp. J276]MCR5864001.1 HAD-IA family hydrolase [Aquincola sp. J276]